MSFKIPTTRHWLKALLPLAIVWLISFPLYAITISGNITSDTTWENTNEAYVINGTVQVAFGTTLTINSGVTVKGGTLEAFGTISIKGSSSSVVTLEDTNLRWGRNEPSQPGLIEMDYCLFDEGGLLDATGYARYGGIQINHSFITNAPMIYLWYPETDIAIENSVFQETGGISVGARDRFISLKNNVFIRQTTDPGPAFEIWADYDDTTVTISKNSFMSTDRIALGLKYSASLPGSAIENYWNTNDQTVIESMILDGNDDLSLNGEISYQPYLTEHDTDTVTVINQWSAYINFSDFSDYDGDGDADILDADDDNDGINDDDDVFPLDATEWVDFDGDGTGNNADTDDDNDGVIDTEDDLPLDASETLDTDGDGTGNNADTDDDGDGTLDVNDPYPLVAPPTLTFNYAGNTDKPLAGISLNYTESDGTVTIFTTDASGQVTLPSTTTNPYTLSGSFTASGEDPISLIDAIWILQHAGELRTLTADQLKAADVSGDGEVDVLDAVWILQHLGELRTLSPSLVFLDAVTGKALSETTFSPTDTPNIMVIRMGDVDQSYDPTTVTGVSLSANGKTLTISVLGNDDSGSTSGYNRIYDWDGKAWVQRGSNIDLRLKSDLTDPNDTDLNLVDVNEPSYLDFWDNVVDFFQNEVTSLTFTYANSSTPIAGVKVIMTESDGTITVLVTDANGQITLPSTSNTYTLSASLAETGEDPISLIDAIHILQYGGELRTLTDDQKIAADVNADGEVDILDAIWILQHLGELRTLDKNLIFLDANTGNPLSETTFSATATPNISVIRKGDVDGDFDPSSITNHAPILTGNIPESFSIFENSSIVYDFDATDLEGDSIYFIISGLDSSLFKINSSGVLSFINAPDYENPQDADKDNIYDVGVSVTDTNPTAKNSMARALDFITSNSGYDSSVRVKNFDEDVISLTMTGEDGTSSSPPKIIISLVVDSYTSPTSIAILYENLASSSQYWTNAGAPTEENFQMTYEYSFTAPENAPTGQWRIRTIRVNTADGLIDHLETYLNNKGFTTRATLYNPNSDTNKPILNSVSPIEVNGNDSDSNTSIVVKFEITATDTENGYQKAHSRWTSPADEGGWALVGGWGSTDLSISPPKTTFTANLDAKTVSGLYKMEDIRLYDKAGNRHMYYCLEREGEYRLLSEDDTSVDGTNYGGCTVNIENPIQDNSKPVLTNFSITALVDESNGRKKIGHSIEIDNKTSWTDQETGLRRMYLRILGPNGFRRDIYDGDLGFSGETLLPLDADSGEYYVSYFFVTDLALNDNKYYKTELDDLGFTTSITFD